MATFVLAELQEMNLPPKPKIDISLFRQETVRSKGRNVNNPVDGVKSVNTPEPDCASLEHGAKDLETKAEKPSVDSDDDNEPTTGVQRALNRYSLMEAETPTTSPRSVQYKMSPVSLNDIPQLPNKPRIAKPLHPPPVVPVDVKRPIPVTQLPPKPQIKLLDRSKPNSPEKDRYADRQAERADKFDAYMDRPKSERQFNRVLEPPLPERPSSERSSDRPPGLPRRPTTEVLNSRPLEPRTDRVHTRSNSQDDKYDRFDDRSPSYRNKNRSRSNSYERPDKVDRVDRVNLPLRPVPIPEPTSPGVYENFNSATQSTPNLDSESLRSPIRIPSGTSMRHSNTFNVGEARLKSKDGIPKLPARSPPSSQVSHSPVVSRHSSIDLQAAASPSKSRAGPIFDESPTRSIQNGLNTSNSSLLADSALDDKFTLKTHNVLKNSPQKLPLASNLKPKRILACSDKYVLLISASKLRVELYNLSLGCTLLWKLKLAARSAVFTSDDEVWVGLSNGQIQILDVRNGVAVQKLDKHHTKPITLLSCNKMVVTSMSAEDGRVCTWPLTGVRPMHVNRVLGVPAYSAAGGDPFVLYTTKDHRVDVYTLESNFLPICHNLPKKGAKFGVCTAVTTQDDTLFCGQNDGIISIFSKNKRLGSLNAGIHAVTALAVSECGELWVGTSSGEVLIFVLNLQENSATLVRQFKLYTSSQVFELVSAGPAMTVLDRNTDFVLFSSAKTPVAKGQDDFDPAMNKSRSVSISTAASNDTGSVVLDQMVDGTNHSSPSSQETAQVTHHRVHDFKVSILTWNVGSCSPDEADPQWLLMHGDICVYGLQEVTELESKQQQMATMLGSTPLEHDEWRVFLEQINSVRGFKLASFKEMVGILTCVFVKNDIDVSSVSERVVKTGMGGTYGNKGGVITSMYLDGVSFNFINVHLAAGQSSIMQRNKDANQVMTACPQSQYTFFFGDTNYRLNTVRERAFQLIQQLDFTSLRRLDQLLQQISKNPSFILSQFAEGELNFAPTYKFDRMTSRYDTSDKKRVPAYCDRILFLGDGVRVDYYSSVNTLCSDHKAVVGYYTVPGR